MEGLFAPSHLIILLVIVLLLFGGKKIPELMRGVGQGVGELQKGLNDAKSKMSVSLDQETPSDPAALQAASTKAIPSSSSDAQKV